MIKKHLFIIFLILTSFKIYSQKCKNDKDPFTNEIITSFNFNRKTVYFEVKNERILFDIVFNYWGEREYEFEKGTEILIKLENGSKFDLKTIKKSSPKIKNVTSSSGYFPGFRGGMITSSSENFTAYSFAFKLTKAELKKLAGSKIDIVRIPDTDEGKFIDLKAKGRTKKKIKAIKKGATCINENI